MHNLHPVPGGGHTNIYEPGQAIYVPHIDTFWMNTTTMLEYLVCQTTDVVEVETRAENWSVFPNPVSDGAFSIQAPEDVQGMEVLVTDFSGKIVFHAQNIQNQSVVRLNNLAAGVYTIRISDMDHPVRQFSVKKLVLCR